MRIKLVGIKDIDEYLNNEITKSFEYTFGIYQSKILIQII